MATSSFYFVADVVMKVIKLQPRRRQHVHSEADLNATNSSPKQKKKALLVGIKGLNGSLKGPHKDVEEMRKLLIEHYGYNSADITTMIDDNKSHLQPTNANLRREMEALVAGAKRGDHFFFHYAGHVIQGEPDPKSTEEDNMEEYIVPSDGDQNNLETCIQDDTLRELLVNHLPPGARLVAVFDSCHSASLLDLEHFRCNRVYVPWTSKGRRKSDSIRNNVQRRQAIIRTRTIQQHTRMTEANVKFRQTAIGQLCNSTPSAPSQVSSLFSSIRPSITSVSTSTSMSTQPSMPDTDTYFSQTIPYTPVSTAPTTPTSLSPANTVSFSTVPVEKLKQMANASAVAAVPLRKPSKLTLKLPPMPGTLSRAGTLTGNLTRSGTITRSGAILTKTKKTQATIKTPYTPPPATTAPEEKSAPTGTATRTPQLSSEPVGQSQPDSDDSEVSFVESPVQAVCSGWCGRHNCETDDPDNQRQPSVGDVISLSSCKDKQLAWEVGEGHSMTQILVQELRKDPHPTMKDLMLTISHKLHTAAVSMHQETKAYKDEWVEYRKRKRQLKPRGMSDTDGLEMNNFQDPELSSRWPLDIRQKWNM